MVEIVRIEEAFVVGFGIGLDCCGTTPVCFGFGFGMDATGFAVEIFGEIFGETFGVGFGVALGERDGVGSSGCRTEIAVGLLPNNSNSLLLKLYLPNSSSFGSPSLRDWNMIGFLVKTSGTHTLGSVDNLPLIGSVAAAKVTKPIVC